MIWKKFVSFALVLAIFLGQVRAETWRDCIIAKNNVVNAQLAEWQSDFLRDYSLLEIRHLNQQSYCHNVASAETALVIAGMLIQGAVCAAATGPAIGICYDLLLIEASFALAFICTQHILCMGDAQNEFDINSQILINQARDKYDDLIAAWLTAIETCGPNPDA